MLSLLVLGVGFAVGIVVGIEIVIQVLGLPPFRRRNRDLLR